MVLYDEVHHSSQLTRYMGCAAAGLAVFARLLLQSLPAALPLLARAEQGLPGLPDQAPGQQPGERALLALLDLLLDRCGKGRLLDFMHHQGRKAQCLPASCMCLSISVIGVTAFHGVDHSLTPLLRASCVGIAGTA